MDIEKFEQLIKQRAEDSLDLKLGDQSWLAFKNANGKNKRNNTYLFYLLSFLFIVSFSFLTGMYYAKYQNKISIDSNETVQSTLGHAATVQNLNSKNDAHVLRDAAGNNATIDGKISSGKKHTGNAPFQKTNHKAITALAKILPFESTNSIQLTKDKSGTAVTLSNPKILTSENNDELWLQQNKTQKQDAEETNHFNPTLINKDISKVISPLFNTIADVKYSHVLALKHGIEPAKKKFVNQNYLNIGSLVFIKEHEHNYVGWRMGYYHEVKKNFRLFGSVYKVKDEVELETQIIPEHFPAPQPGLEIEHIKINKSTFVLPFGINYTYPKFKIKPFVSLGFAPEYAKINRVKYQYKNTSDNIPEETKMVNIKTSNFYLYSDFGLQGPIYHKFDWKVSMHLLNYLSGHEDGAENEDNFKSYINVGLNFKL